MTELFAGPSTVQMRLASGNAIAGSFSLLADQDSFLQTGTGAVIRSANSRFGDTISLKDFGADGVATDDSAAFTLIEALSGTNTVFKPAGVYPVTGVNLNNIYVGPGRIEIGGNLKAEKYTRLATPPTNIYDPAVNGEQFFVGDGAFADRKFLQMTSGARVETSWNDDAFVVPYELIPDMIEIENGDGTLSGSGATSIATAGAGSSEQSQVAANRKTITNITVAATPVVTVGTHTYIIGDSVRIWGVVGTMDTVLQNRKHEITGIGGTTITINTDTTGLTYTSGGTTALSVNRTFILNRRDFLDHWGYGDAAGYSMQGRVSVEVEDDSWLAGNAIGVVSGDLTGRANGVYLNPYETQLREANGADINVYGKVDNFSRVTDNSPKFAGDQSSNYSNKDCIWIGYRPQNIGSAYTDAVISPFGNWKVGYDLTACTLADMKVGVALKSDDRIYFNAAAKKNAEKTNSKLYCTDNLEAANSVYCKHDTATDDWHLVYKNVAILQVDAAGLTVTGEVNASTDFKVAGTQVLGARIATWTATTGTEIRTNFGDASLSDTSQALRALIVDLKATGVIGDV